MNLDLSALGQFSLAFVIGFMLGVGFAFVFAFSVLARRGFKRALDAD